MLEDLFNENYPIKLTEYEKKYEKVKRERNRFAGEIKILIKEVQKREKILETAEFYLTQRIEK